MNLDNLIKGKQIVADINTKEVYIRELKHAIAEMKKKKCVEITYRTQFLSLHSINVNTSALITVLEEQVQVTSQEVKDLQEVFKSL